LDSLYTPRLTGASFVETRYYGSPFVTPDWTRSTIVLNTGDTIIGEKIKYNGYVDEVMWINQHNYKNSSWINQISKNSGYNPTAPIQLTTSIYPYRYTRTIKRYFWRQPMREICPYIFTTKSGVLEGILKDTKT
jgi:hypothetical protein